MKLTPLLSAGAQICYPGSDCFSNATNRFVHDWGAPKFDFIVRVGTAEDVQTTVKYANEHNTPFLAVSGGHGFTQSLSAFEGGIGIWMRGLNDVQIADDGQSATVGGGILSGELLHQLWDQGKQAVVGVGECAGAASAVLGGGHGFLQGRYGLMTDNLLSAEMVLANGTSITVSHTEHEDLFWGIRGAGQNFGIVTEFTYKIYDHTSDNELWSYDIMIFPLSELEAIYDIAEAQRRDAPVELGHWGLVLTVPDVDPLNPSIIFTLFYQSSSIPTEFSSPFHALAPLSTTKGTVPLPGLAKLFGADKAGEFCKHGASTWQAHPANVPSYNATALRAAASIISSHAGTPLSGTTLIIEGYPAPPSTIPAASTAFSARAAPLLLAAFVRYPAGVAAADLHAGASEVGRKMQAALAAGAGAEVSSYVNYAAGTESVEALYGYEEWRVRRLRGLKRAVDPEGRFGYYLPIDVEGAEEGDGEEGGATRDEL